MFPQGIVLISRSPFFVAFFCRLAAFQPFNMEVKYHSAIAYPQLPLLADGSLKDHRGHYRSILRGAFCRDKTIFCNAEAAFSRLSVLADENYYSPVACLRVMYDTGLKKPTDIASHLSDIADKCLDSKTRHCSVELVTHIHRDAAVVLLGIREQKGTTVFDGQIVLSLEFCLEVCLQSLHLYDKASGKAAMLKEL